MEIDNKESSLPPIADKAKQSRIALYDSEEFKDLEFSLRSKPISAKRNITSEAILNVLKNLNGAEDQEKGDA